MTTAVTTTLVITYCALKKKVIKVYNIVIKYMKNRQAKTNEHHKHGITTPPG